MSDGLKNFDEGFIPPVFEDGGGFDLLDRKGKSAPTRVDRLGLAGSPKSVCSPVSRRVHDCAALPVARRRSTRE